MNKSYWKAREPLPRYAAIGRPGRFDVVVIGGGITGITAAYLLKRAGKRVALVERRRCADMDTSATTAHLTCVLDTSLTDLASRFGEDHARAAWDAGFAAINEIDSIIRRHRIECDFAWVQGFLHLRRTAGDTADADAAAHDEKALERLRADTALAHRLGFDADFVESVPLMNQPGMRLEGQARVNPRQYLRALLAQIEGQDSAIFEHTPVSEVKTDPLRVCAKGYELSCDDVIIATHDPIVGAAGIVGSTALQTRLSLYTSYALAARVPTGALPDALFWDTGDPYDYLRIARRRDHDVVIFGGGDHKTGQADDTRDCERRLEERFKSLLPDAEVTHQWSGQVIETSDGLPMMGFTADHQYAATGFSGNGITFGTLAAMMARDAVIGRQNPWQKLFDIGRVNLHGVWDYITENKDYPYYLIRDRFAGAEGRSRREVARGAGKVLELHGKKVAVYRRDDGSVTERSAVCTHMGCLVRWNAADRTWDCPCHGSRFDPEGRVLAGPAETSLGPVGGREA